MLLVFNNLGVINNLILKKNYVIIFYKVISLYWNCRIPPSSFIAYVWYDMSELEMDLPVLLIVQSIKQVSMLL